MKAIPSTKFLQTILGCGMVTYIMHVYAKIPEITQPHFELIKLFLQLMGAVIIGTSFIKGVQNVILNGNNKKNEVES